MYVYWRKCLLNNFKGRKMNITATLKASICEISISVCHICPIVRPIYYQISVIIDSQRAVGTPLKVHYLEDGRKFSTLPSKLISFLVNDC